MRLPKVQSILTFCCVVMFCLTKEHNVGDNIIYFSRQESGVDQKALEISINRPQSQTPTKRSQPHYKRLCF